VYRLTLGEEVYRSARHADLGDLRVFNGNDEPVPHSLLRRSSRKAPPDSRQTLPFYPLYENSDHGAGGTLISPLPRADRSSIWNAPDDTSACAPISWIPAERRRSSDPNGYGPRRLSWHGCREQQRSWRLACGEAAAGRSDHGGHRLQRAISNCYSHSSASHDPGHDDMALASVHARLQALEPVLAEQWSGVSGEAAPDPERGFRFDALAALPVNRVRIVLDQDNTLVQLRWYSRNAPGALWHDHGSAVAYRLNLDGTSLISPDLALGTRRDRYWRVEVVDGEAAPLGRKPRLELRRQPDELSS
jgi:hypothetical protein